MSGSDLFDIKCSLPPPKLQMELWVLGIDGTRTGECGLQPGTFGMSLAYNLRGNLKASLRRHRLENPLIKVGPNPANRETLRRDSSVEVWISEPRRNVTRRSLGFSLGYGKELLLFPDDLSRDPEADGPRLMRVSGMPRSPAQPIVPHSGSVGSMG